MSSWLSGQRYGNTHRLQYSEIEGYHHQIPSNIYYERYSEIIKGILADPETCIEVASDANDPLWTAGYCISGPLKLHWIFVKPEFRKRGIARLMLADKTIKFTTATTKAGRAITDAKGWEFNPFLIQERT